jgi:glycosyltransferase involved in cell wall biosynthesis/GT2 family glycosyltransferase
MRLSIIINTYNREPYLRRLLPVLDRQTGCDLEVVVVNGPSTDGTAQLLARYAGRIKALDTPTRNLSHSRNLGVAAAAGDVLAFIDDDALPMDERWAARYVEAFAGDGAGGSAGAGGAEKLGAAGGPVWHHDTPWKEFDGGLTGDYGFQVFDVSKGIPSRGRWWPRVQGCNCAFAREALVSIGGFDEFFLYYHDETDMCLRLARAGFATRHLPDNGVRHYPAPSERRTSKYDRNWTVVTQSDTYFALKNGGDALPIRVLRTIAAAPRKHYFRDINSYLAHGEIGVGHWLRLLSQWAKGVGVGFSAGLKPGRAFGKFDAAPPPFVPFARPRAADRLTVALLAQRFPGQSGYGGIGRYTYDLARVLHERGHTVHLICRDTQRRVHETPGFAIHGITDEEIAAQPSGTDLPITGKNLRYALAVAHRLRELDAAGEEIDVVHATNWDGEGAAVIRAGVYPTALTLVSPLAQVIQSERWTIDRDLRGALSFDHWQILAADTVAVPSEGVLKSYRELMDVRPEQIARLRVAPLGIVPDEGAAPPPRREGLRQLLFVGRLERRKGIQVLLEALPGLMASFPDWECRIAGNDTIVDGDGQTHKAKFLARHAGRDWLARVHFEGVVSDAALRDAYRACDLFVAPSIFESFGLIFHEAMQYGKPVVGCRTGGVPETVADGVEGLLVEPGDAGQLAQALARLMRDEPLRRALGDAGRARVLSRQNADTMATHYEALYRDVIARVGADRVRRRRALWARPLALLGPHIAREGDWSMMEAFPGGTFLVSQAAGSSLTFSAAAGSTIVLTCLRHNWSGVLEARIEGQPVRVINLYKAGDIDGAFVVRLPVSPAGPPVRTVRLSVHAERHPESFGRQIWIRQIVCEEAIAESA